MLDNNNQQQVQEREKKNLLKNVVEDNNNVEKNEDNWKVIPASSTAKNCKNYIRGIVDDLHLEPNPDKKVIALSIGDPTVYGNLSAPTEAIEAVIKSAKNGCYNGYGPCVGFESIRESVAEYLSYDGVKFTQKDVLLCSGCSSSLEHCITVLADCSNGQNILIPRPGFPIYRTLAETIGIEVKTYNLLPEKNWEIDLNDLEMKIDENTAALIINNPSNPCGSVYDESHLRNVLEIAYRYKVPVIADEIYERLVFPGKRFVSTASIDIGVPILICGGLAKRFLVPGWRLGWIIVHDPIGVLDEIRAGLNALSQRIIGSNTIIQGAIPDILLKTPQKFHDDLINTLYENAKLIYGLLKDVNGLQPYMPDGTMYLMLKVELDRFPQFNTGLDFVSKLMEEQSVFCLPGDCFELPGFMRLVITVPGDLLREACERMEEFCNKYYT